MTDPVVAGDGYTYKRSRIKEWFKNHDTSPMTRNKIIKQVITNYSMRSSLSQNNYPLTNILAGTDLISSHSPNLTLLTEQNYAMPMFVFAYCVAINPECVFNIPMFVFAYRKMINSECVFNFYRKMINSECVFNFYRKLFP